MAEPLVDWTIKLDASQAAKAADDLRAKVDDASSAIVDLTQKTMQLSMESRKHWQEVGNAWDEQDVADSIKAMVSARDKLRESLQKMVQDRREAATTLRNMGIGVIGAGALALRGMANAGTAESMQGQNLQAHQQQLNRQVASIFAPLTNETTKYTAQLTNWLRGLTEPQKEAIRTVTVFSTSMTVLGLTVPRAARALATLAVSATAAARAEQMKATTDAVGGITGMAKGSGAIALAGRLGIAAAIGGAVLSATPQGRESLSRLVSAFQPAVDTFARAVTPFADAAGRLANRIASWVERGVNAVAPSESTLQYLEDGGVIGHWLAKMGIRHWFFGNENVDRRGNRNPSMFSPAAGGGGSDIEGFIQTHLDSGFKIDIQQTQVNLLREIRDAVRARVNTPEVQNKFAGNPFVGPPVQF